MNSNFSELKLMVVLFLGIVIWACTITGEQERGINNLRLAEEGKAWQLNLQISSFQEVRNGYRLDSEGLWQENRTIKGLELTLDSSVDINQHIGVKGGASYVYNSTSSENVNLWTGQDQRGTSREEKFGGASLQVRFDLWESSNLETHLSLPVLGGSVEAGITWSRDPVMIQPTFSTDGSGLGLSTGVSFVANSKVALLGSMSLRKGKDLSRIRVKGGILYRSGKYRGVQMSAAVEGANNPRASVKIGLSYGKEIS